jgi:hypothetical protein
MHISQTNTSPGYMRSEQNKCYKFIVKEDVVNLLVAQIIIKTKSNFNIIFRFNFKADSVSPSGLFNTDIVVN